MAVALRHPGLDGLLRCPATGEPLGPAVDGELVGGDGRRYRILDGVPVLIADERSVFRAADVRLAPRAASPPRRRILRPSHNVGAARRLAELAGLLGSARVLVVGSGDGGEGMHVLAGHPAIGLVETDVRLGARTHVVCDAHDLPFVDGSFDGVVIQAVLEAVPEPARVAAEIHRVLRPGGLVYSEMPFMQQVHEGAHDFNRFTQLGHRRLFRWFDELGSGPVGGPGMALAWSVRYFAMTLAGPSRRARTVLNAVAALATWWLPYLDEVLVRLPAASDAAAGTYFLGRRRETPVDDAEVIAGYRGGQAG
jgi:SAM-dependent methyltransferase